MSREILGVDQGGQYVWSRDYEDLYHKAEERIKELERENTKLKIENDKLRKKESK